MTTAADLRDGIALLGRLPGYLRHPVTDAEAGVVLRQRLERRAADFLALARRGIYGRRRTTPYRWLLARAGCEYGDLERLVAKEGVEGALGALLRHGVYLTIEELKGRTAVKRSGEELELRPEELANPLAAGHIPAQTAGSRGQPTRLRIDLAWLRDWAINTRLEFACWGGEDRTQARWSVPGGAALAGMLRYYAGSGVPPARWFSPVDPRSPELPARYRWSARLLRAAGRRCRRSFPAAEHVSPEAPRPILEWLRLELRADHTPHLVTYASAAARLCEEAERVGVDISGTRFLVGGEPLTAARLAQIRRVGALPLPFYASMDAGLIGSACLDPGAIDEVHLFHDLVAVAQAESPAGRPGSLFVSTLRPTAPLLLLNASLGDRAAMASRRCGCPLEAHGWTTHLWAIASEEKLTAGGMTLLDADVVRVLEDVLPARFGGNGFDFQLVEDEGEGGRPRLRLLVHPRLGPLDPQSIVEVFLASVGQVSGAAQVMSLAWRTGGVVRAERRPPLATASGKVVHVRAGGAGLEVA